MRIALVTGEFPPDIGGTATHSALLLEELPKRDHSVHVITLTDDLRTTKESGIIRYPRRWPWPVRLALVAEWLFRHRHDYDVVFAFSLHPAAVAGGRVARRPVVVRIPGDPAWERARRLGLTKATFEEFQLARGGGLHLRAMRWIRNWSARRATTIVVPSDHLREAAEGWANGSAPIAVIPSGVRVPPERAVPRRPNGLNAIFVGRLIPHKHVGVLLEAVAQTEGVLLEVVGDGPERANLERRVEESGAIGRVNFLGTLDHDKALQRVSSADVLVLPSEWEGLPTVAAEALACGIPVIAARVGGIPEIVADGVNGVLLDDATPDSIAGALAALRNDAVFRERLSVGARHNAASWSVERFVGTIEALLTQALRGRWDARRQQHLRTGLSRGALSRTVICLSLLTPVRDRKDADHYILETLRHRCLDWVLDEGWNVEFWGLRRTRGRKYMDGRVQERGLWLPFADAPVPLLAPLAWLTQLALTLVRPRAGIVVAPIPLFGAGAAAARLLGRLQAPFVVRVLARTSSNALYVRPSRLRFHFIEAVERFVLRRANLVLPISGFTRALAESVGVRSERMLTLPYPAGSPDDVPRVPKTESRSLRVACAARLVPEKGIDVLLHAFAKVADEFPDVRLEVAGDGVERPALESLAASLGIARCVRWHGFLPISEMPAFYGAAAVAVLPSLFEEGLGRSHVEAGLAGCALVGTNLGGVVDIVRPGKTGILVHPGDVAALADALRALLGSPVEAQRLGRGAREEALAIYARRDASLSELRVIFNSFVSPREATEV